MNSIFRERTTDRIRWGYLTAFMLLLLSYILTFYSTQKVLDQQERVTHTTNVINTLDDLLSEVKEAESAFRGFIITKNESFLNDYYKAPNFVDSTLLELRHLTIDNNAQQKRLDTLQVYVKEKLDLFAKGLRLYKTNNQLSDTLISMACTGKLLMTNIKSATMRMQSVENDLVVTRTHKVAALSNFIKVINIASIVIAIVLAFYSITTFNKENKARQEADEQAINLREQLELQINELNKLNIELVQLRSIEKFAATGRISRTIAHEVRNPLTNINLATEHLKSEIQSGPETDMLFEMITRNSNRINDLISDLLNSTKATHLNFIKVNVNKMLDSSLEFAQDRLSLKEIKVEKNYAALPEILADVQKINIAFLNIIVNAIEAMEAKKGILTLTTEDKNNKCMVTISDNGKGMDQDSLSKLFEPYFTTKEKGNGLGLTNTQNIILSHHANIYAESTEASGTSFIITFNYA